MRFLAGASITCLELDAQSPRQDYRLTAEVVQRPAPIQMISLAECPIVRKAPEPVYLQAWAPVELLPEFAPHQRRNPAAELMERVILAMCRLQLNRSPAEMT